MLFFFSFLVLLFYFIYGKNEEYLFTIFHTNDSFYLTLSFILLCVVHGRIDGHRESEILDLKISDYYNFLTHMKANAKKNEIVLAFDSGDLAQGSGLSDATVPYGSFLFEMFKELPIDAQTIGKTFIFMIIGLRKS
jgi:2',3'-cyclic-nucleotide 2'-phosphodiesterase (5'-nucleotidase family)